MNARVVCLAFGLASFAASARADELRLSWDTDEGCASREHIEAGVEDVLGRPISELSSTWAEVMASAKRQGEGWELRVRVVGRDGSVNERRWGWGNTYYGATEPPAGTFESVVTGASHFSCALDPDHHASCWGAMYFEDEAPALLDAPDDEFQTLVAGMAHVCGLTLDGEARCWGYGVPSDDRGDVPYNGQASPPDGQFVELAAGFWHTCGLRSDGSVECWGAGEPGDPVALNGAHKGQSDPPEL